MSSANEGTFDPNDAVLKHASKSRSVTLSADPSREELALDWTLSKGDVALVLKQRGRDNLCRFAVQLCAARRFGRFLPHYQDVPPAVLGYLCQQLATPPVLFLPGRARDNTEADYQRRIAAHLGLTPFDEVSAAILDTWVQRQTSGRMFAATGRDGLLAEAERLLRARRIIVPPQATLERAVNSAYQEAEKAIFEAISRGLADETKKAIDAFLETPEGTRTTTFFRFAETPPEPKAKFIAAWLSRHAELATVCVSQFSFAGVSGDLVRRLATATKTYSAWQLKRFDAHKRYALAACFLFEAKTTMLDHLVAMHYGFMNSMEREAKNEWEAQHRALRPRVKKGVNVIRSFTEHALALSQDETVSLHSAVASAGAEELREAVATCRAFEQLQEDGKLHRLYAKYGNFRRYFGAFATLPFACESGSERLLNALELLRKLDRGEVKELSRETDPSFVPHAWRKALIDPATRRKTWEIALALALKDALKSGDVYLPESRQHASFWSLCYDEPTWGREQASAYTTLELPSEPQVATQALLEGFTATAERTASRLNDNPFVYLVDGALRTKRDKARPLPEGTTELKGLFDRKRARVRVEALLAGIDARCHFSDKLVPLDGAPLRGAQEQARERPAGRRDYADLLAAVVAHGTNLGVRTMADSTEGVSIDQLLRVSATCLRPDALEAANAVLVNYHRGLETSLSWGDGTVASSDGQRFGVQESTLLSSFYPRYFGYYDRAVTVYTHVSDQHSVFSTQVISCSEREALYVLDGLLGTDLPVQMHHTDTHGYTEQLFGLCYLLGVSFMPRIKDLKKQRLYKPVRKSDATRSHVHPALSGIFSGTTDLDLIEEQWDALVRVAASLKNRIVSAHVIAKRLIGAGATNRLAKALTHLGRLIKTIYLLRYIDDDELRRQTERQLNRGELRHKLAKYVFFMEQGQFRRGDYDRIMSKASCLSLISNAILIWNTLLIGQVLEEAGRDGKAFSPEAVSHVSPLAYRHVIVNGTYDFSHVG